MPFLPYQNKRLKKCCIDLTGSTYRGLARWLGKLAINHFSFAYSALACFRMGMSESASFHTVRKSL